MRLLSVTPAGLRSLAAFCEASSAKVAVTVTPEAAATSFQPSTAAVKTIHAETGLVGRILSARMLSTGAHVNTAVDGYSAQDAEAAGALNDVVVTT